MLWTSRKRNVYFIDTICDSQLEMYEFFYSTFLNIHFFFFVIVNFNENIEKLLLYSILLLFLISVSIFFFKRDVHIDIENIFLSGFYERFKNIQIFNYNLYFFYLIIFFFLYKFLPTAILINIISYILLILTIYERVYYDDLILLPINFYNNIFKPLRLIKKILYFLIFIYLFIYFFSIYALFLFYTPIFIGIILEIKFDPYE